MIPSNTRLSKVYDLARVLQGENGRFEATAPNGVRAIVTCEPGHSISSLQLLDVTGKPVNWDLTKLAEFSGDQTGKD